MRYNRANSTGEGFAVKPRYRVTLTEQERQELETLKRGRASAKRFLYARALLLCDAGPQGPAWREPGFPRRNRLHPPTQLASSQPFFRLLYAYLLSLRRGLRAKGYNSLSLGIGKKRFDTNWQTNDNFLVGADPCVRPESRAHTRVPPYRP